jgi:glycosyltransferase involved in cell wall biosynthesis
MNPLVSVVVPTFRRAWCLRRALGSVLAQTVRDLEVIVVDDASDDETGDVVAGFAEPRLRLLTHARTSGTSMARNTGFKVARGRFVAFIDSDDEWLPHKLERQVEFLERNPTLVGTNCGIRMVSDEGGAVSTWIPRAGGSTLETHLGMQDEFDAATMWTFRHEALAALQGPFDQEFLFAQVRDLLVRVAHQGSLGSVPEVLAVVHDHHHLPRNQLYPLRLKAEAHCLFLRRHERELLARPLVFARLLVDSARRALELGDTAAARRDLRRAITLAPFNLSARAFSAATGIPPGAHNLLRAVTRRMRGRDKVVADTTVAHGSTLEAGASLRP